MMIGADYLNSGGGSGIPKVASGDAYEYGVIGGNIGDGAFSGLNISAGRYKADEFDVSDISSVQIRYYSNGAYASNYGILGYAVDGVETQITDYGTSWKDKTIDLTNAQTFYMWGEVLNVQGAGARGVYGMLVFS